MGQQEEPRRSPAQVEFRLLDDRCNLKTFSCGERSIDDWLRTKARKKHKRYIARTTTAHVGANPSPCGFYCLILTSHPLGELDKSQQDGWESSGFPAIHLHYLAVQRSMQSEGIGTAMLGHAIKRTYEVSKFAGVYGLTLNSLNENSTAFYYKLGFRSYGSGGNKMFLPIQSIVDLLAPHDVG